MKNRSVSLLLILGLLMCSSFLQAQEVRIGPWEKINDKDGISVYVRTNPNVHPLKEARMVGVINTSAANVENIFRDMSTYKRVLFMSKTVETAEIPGIEPQKDRICVYMLQGAPWPVQDRDGYGVMDFYVHQPTGEVLLTVKMVDPGLPQFKGVTRLKFCEMEWMIRPIDENHCEVTYQNMLDAGGSIDLLPTSVVNYVMKWFGVFTIRNLREVAKEDKYRHATGYITQTPWPDKLRYYAEGPRAELAAKDGKK